jgi:excisionase family DNA binding protein
VKNDRKQTKGPSIPDREATMKRLREAGFSVDRYSHLAEPLLTTSEVALILRTTSRTVRNWADGGKIETLRSLGGRRLFPASAILTALDSMVEERPVDEARSAQRGRPRRTASPEVLDPSRKEH